MFFRIENDHVEMLNAIFLIIIVVVGKVAASSPIPNVTSLSIPYWSVTPLPSLTTTPGNLTSTSVQPTPLEALCGGNFTADEGSISSPNYPEYYSNNGICIYNITVAKGRQIRFEIVEADFKSTNCNYDFLLFTENLNPLGIYCTSGISVYTKGRTLVIVFYTKGRSVTGKRFLGRWISYQNNSTIGPCTYHYVSANGTLQSPNYPSNYQNSLHCRYVIEVPRGKAIRFEIVDAIFELSNCFGDHLLFLDNFRNLGYFCQSGVVIYTQSNKLEIVFNTDASNTAKGFKAKWTSYEKVSTISAISCGGYVQSDYGSIELPNATTNANLHCIYTIKVSEGKLLKFEITKFSKSYSSHGSYVYFRENGTSLGRFTSSGAVIYTKGNVLEIRLRTSVSFFHQSFKGRWNAVDKPLMSITSKSCGGYFNTDSGTIMSPNYPSNYDNNLKCGYHIVVTRGKYIRFEITDAQFHNGYYTSSCIYDYLLLRAYTIDKVCRSGTVLYTQNSRLNVELITNSIFTSRGFKGKWVAVDEIVHLSTTASTERCGRIFKADNGTIISPNYPLNYPNNLNCRYLIVVPKGKQIQFEIVDALFENSSTCNKDYLLFKEVKKNISVSCTNGSKVSTQGNELIIILITDSSKTAKGFKGKWFSFSTSKSKNEKSYDVITASVVPAVFPIFILLFFLGYFCYKKKKRETTSTQGRNHRQAESRFDTILNDLATIRPVVTTASYSNDAFDPPPDYDQVINTTNTLTVLPSYEDVCVPPKYEDVNGTA